MSKLIKKLGFRRISARPQHPKNDPEIRAEYKDNFETWLGMLSATEPLDAR